MNPMPSHDKAHILLIDDEEHLAAGLKLNLELEGYAVDVAHSGREGAQLLLRPQPYDAIILDVMLPDVDGFAFCDKVRRAGNFTPVLMLTARDVLDDRIAGLEVGADDYLTKPFDLQELLARVRSLLRRRSWQRVAEHPGPRQPLRLGDASIDFETHEVRVDGKEVHLTKLELDLLRYFVDNPGRVLTRQELQEHVWKLSHFSSSRLVDNMVMRLRRHFEADPAHPKYFVSVRGSGYRFVRAASA